MNMTVLWFKWPKLWWEGCLGGYLYERDLSLSSFNLPINFIRIYSRLFQINWYWNKLQNELVVSSVALMVWPLEGETNNTRHPVQKSAIYVWTEVIKIYKVFTIWKCTKFSRNLGFISDKSFFSFPTSFFNTRILFFLLIINFVIR